jgi:hypothetical protein
MLTMTQSKGVRVITPRNPDGVIYAAGDDFGLESEGHLVVYARGSKIAVYAPGQWISAEVLAD